MVGGVVVRGEITEIRSGGDGEVLSRKVSGPVFFGGCSQEDWQTNLFLSYSILGILLT